MKTCAIVGINWGDEGKGRMVDLLTQDYDIVVRYQGGGNAGHTVINEYGKFALHLLPSGIFRPNVVNILGNGVALDMKSLCGEMENVTAKGVSVTPENLKISDRASLVLPWHILLDELEEERLKDKKYGSTKQGIAPFYSDKYQKKTIQAGELFYPEYLVRHLEDLLEWKNLTLTGVYGAKPYTMAQLCDYLHTYGQKLRPFICDTGSWLRKAQQDGKSILFEAQLGALRDLDYGIYPYTTSSNAVAAYAPVGSGLPSARLDEVVGVVKAYSTCVGEGPFVCEWFGPEADRLRKAGFEYGAKTGRPRRVGPLDIVATLYGQDPRLHQICGQRSGNGCVSLPRGARNGEARYGISGRLGLRYLRRPHMGSASQAGAGLCGVYRKGHRLPHRVRIRRRGAGCIHQAVSGHMAQER